MKYLYLQRCKNPQWWWKFKVKGKCKTIQTLLPCQVHFKGLFTCCESNFFEIKYVLYPFVVFMFVEVQRSTASTSTQIHREMQHAQLLDKSPISDLQDLQNAMLSTQLPTHWFLCKMGLLFFLPSFELYVNYPLFRNRHSLTCDVLMCAEVQYFFGANPRPWGYARESNVSYYSR